MPRSKDGYKFYKAGDPIHIVVTQDFADVANDFFTYCKEKGYNPSEIIRQAIVEWYRRETPQIKSVDSLPPDLSFDEKLAHLVSQRASKKTVKGELLSAKDILGD
jgi:hypothetical protein